MRRVLLERTESLMSSTSFIITNPTATVFSVRLTHFDPKTTLYLVVVFTQCTIKISPMIVHF
jgi:hypothetical protein